MRLCRFLPAKKIARIRLRNTVTATEYGHRIRSDFANFKLAVFFLSGRTGPDPAGPSEATGRVEWAGSAELCQPNDGTNWADLTRLAWGWTSEVCSPVGALRFGPSWCTSCGAVAGSAP